MFCTSAALTALYIHRKNATPQNSLELFPNHRTEQLLRLQSLYGYNAHSLVGISEDTQKWFDFRTQSGLTFTEHGRIRLVAGEMLGSEENIQLAVKRFIDQAQADKKLVAFMPATEKFARAVAPLGFEAVKIGAAPYFDLQKWNPRGNKAKKMRASTNQARRAGVSVEQIFERNLAFCLEVADLCESWSKTRRAAIKFGWLFELAPFKHAEHKKFFAARNAEGKLVGLLAASPIPARSGWYLEDVLRFADSPNGTTDLLIYETLKTMASEGAKLATLGTSPLAGDGADSFLNNKYGLSKSILNFLRKNFETIYNFKGLRHFKGKFVPCWWESEYILLPKGFFVPPRVANAFAHALLPNGLLQLLLRQLFREI
jgi:phosphatidylglycerol lysyltransferase